MDVGLEIKPILTAVVTIRDKDGNIKFEGPVTLTPIEDNNNGSDSNDSGT